MWLLVAPRAAKVLMVMRASGLSRFILASAPRNGAVRGSQPETTARKSGRRLTRRVRYRPSDLRPHHLNQDRVGVTAPASLIRAPRPRMGIQALYRKPNTSKPAPGHKIYPYLLRGMTIDRPNQVWAMDITYVPMARGFVYLAAVVDWFSRR